MRNTAIILFAALAITVSRVPASPMEAPALDPSHIQVDVPSSQCQQAMFEAPLRVYLGSASRAGGYTLVSSRTERAYRASADTTEGTGIAMLMEGWSIRAELVSEVLELHLHIAEKARSGSFGSGELEIALPSVDIRKTVQRLNVGELQRSGYESIDVRVVCASVS